MYNYPLNPVLNLALWHFIPTLDPIYLHLLLASRTTLLCSRIAPGLPQLMPSVHGSGLERLPALSQPRRVALKALAGRNPSAISSMLTGSPGSTAASHRLPGLDAAG
jgi:hypothetical protein